MSVFEFAKIGDIDYFRTVEKDILLQSRDEDDNSALYVAAMAFQLYCCELICKKCPEILFHQNRRDKSTVLHHVAGRGQTDMITLFLKVAVEFEGNDKRLLRMLTTSGRSALYFAAENNQFEAAQLLMAADPYGHDTTSDEDTPLWVAMENARKGDLDAAKMRKLILQMQPYQRRMGRRYRTNWEALKKAASDGDLDAIDEIIQFCSVVRDDHDRNFLHNAVAYDYNIEMLKHILKNKDLTSSVLHAQDCDGNTPLHLAAAGGDVEITKLLIEADPEGGLEYGPNDYGETPLLLTMNTARHDPLESTWTRHRKQKRLRVDPTAYRNNRRLIIEKLPSQCMTLSGEKNWTALHYAAYLEDLDAIDDIIQLCANCTELVEAPNNQNFLHIAVLYSRNEVISRTVEHILKDKDLPSSVLHAQDCDGNTPLHLAVEEENLEITELLVKADPDGGLKYGPNHMGETPLLMAMRRHDQLERGDIPRLLIEELPSQSMILSKGEKKWTTSRCCL